MTLTIHTEENDQRQMAVTVEVAEDRVQKAMRAAARKMAKDAYIPGFRKGKAPYQVILRRVGEEALRAEAIEDMVQTVFEEALQQAELEVYGQPSLDDVEQNPLVYKFTVPLTPTVTLGNYRELRREVVEPEITEEAVAAALHAIQERHQTVEPVERPATLGDLVTLSGVGKLLAVAAEEETVEGETAVSLPEETLFDEEQTELMLDANVLFPATPFVEKIVGMSAGDEKSFRFTFSAEYEDAHLAGREVAFDISLLDVKSRTLPELDDELAKLEGSYETLEELRDSVRETLLKQAQTTAKNDLVEIVISDLMEDATIVYPPTAVELEIDTMVDSLKSQITRSGWEWADYLRLQGMDETTIRDQFQEPAVTRLERQLVLRQFIFDEKLTINAEDIDAQIDERLQSFGDNPELLQSMRDYFYSGYAFEMISSEILMNKAHERMKAVLRGEAPDLDSLEIGDAAAADEEE
ncbi:MAG: trigger factor [Chloroflexi bacterium]|nr:trigger factor [Chloroflexota bacterium]